ncbi:hypothetical protein PHYSODRAFT_519269 [Phytophthora sojae]|uniref:EGF-like domain-containing protein n=1 Tax=Phytophthora sojae (strain P6497) TaxID=1094619 RepID=G5A1U4_PHYSP|nr:hypothetical protein PHYSODRAFT_519269 [Phytophthora sojae]EGZ10892.1 hypothetical protein PHYSODRAFT_519269 [Phytophthora sojae]|eukprot:XP_009533637.1 hypothetical protein PHYSODRAFT_519269 [Phytophthora sojae]
MYYIGVYNSEYARGSLGYRLTVNAASDCKTSTLVSTFNAVLKATNVSESDSASASASVGDDSDSLGVCLNGGVCSALSTPVCQCSTGWTGLSCNSPTGFELVQLWSAMENVSLLCSSCMANVTLTRGQVLMFRVPEPLRAGIGLRLTLQSTDQASGGVAPNVYVSEMLPRSLYDFTYISMATESVTQVVEVSKTSFSGDFWVVVHTDYPSTGTSSQLTVGASTSVRRRLADTSSSTASFQLVAEQFEVSDPDSDSSLLTDQTFAHAVFKWVFASSAGIAVFSFAVVLLVIALCFCIFRVARAPENQDKVLARLYPPQSSRGTSSDRGAVSRRANGALVMDIQDPSPGSGTDSGNS